MKIDELWECWSLYTRQAWRHARGGEKREDSCDHGLLVRKVVEGRLLMRFEMESKSDDEKKTCAGVLLHALR